MADTIKKNKNETIMYAEPKNQTIMYADPKITRAYKTSLPAPSGSEQIGKTKLSYFGDERGGVRKPASRMSTYTSVNDRMAEYSKKQAAKKAAPPKAPARKLTEINVPGGGLRMAKPASAKTSRPYTASEARSLAPGNYRSGKVTMGGKTYTGFTVSSRTDSKGRTTKSVGNWTSTKDAGRSANSKGSFAMGAPKGSLFGGSKSSGSKSSGGSSKKGTGGYTSPSGRNLSGKP